MFGFLLLVVVVYGYQRGQGSKNFLEDDTTIEDQNCADDIASLTSSREQMHHCVNVHEHLSNNPAFTAAVERKEMTKASPNLAEQLIQKELPTK